MLKFFSPSGKRKGPSTSSSSETSDIENSPVLRQDSKRPNIDIDTDDMSIQEALESIQKTLTTLATREDVQVLKDQVRGELDKMRSDLEKFSEKITERCEQVESKVFELEEVVDTVRKENASLKRDIEALRESLTTTQREVNDLEQYGRRWNLRIFGIAEQSQEDVVKKVCEVSGQVGVAVTADDIEACHRVGPVGGAASQRGGKGARPRAIIVRLKDRGVRDNILVNRKKLKGKKISIAEDLTYENNRMSTLAYKHSATMSTWTKNGKVFAKLKTGKTVKIPYGCNVDSFLKKEMGGGGGGGEGSG
jgi:hypothetical protein